MPGLQPLQRERTAALATWAGGSVGAGFVHVRAAEQRRHDRDCAAGLAQDPSALHGVDLVRSRRGATHTGLSPVGSEENPLLLKGEVLRWSPVLREQKCWSSSFMSGTLVLDFQSAV